MQTAELSPVLANLFAELTTGADKHGNAFVLNSGDVGMLASLAQLSAASASRSVHDGATIAAHVQHVRYGLSLMNRWARDGGNPFADAKWDEAWKTKGVDEAQWREIRQGCESEVRAWLEVLRAPRTVNPQELSGLVASIAHLAYHLGAIRQIDKSTRGPKEGTFK